MKNKILLGVFIITTLFISCNKEDIESNKENDTKKGVVIRERDPNSPLILSQRSEVESLTKGPSSTVSFNNSLGMSFRCKVFPLGSMEDLGYSVIDLQRLKKDHPDYITSTRIGHSLAESFSYANFDRYTINSSVTKKIDGGASLNLGLFKIGAKSSMTNVFSEASETNRNRVYGELNIEVRDSSYRIQMSSNIKRIIMLNYISRYFRDELYNTTPSELFSNYGGFVLTNFIVGGRATAVYTGIDNSTSDVSSKEQKMRTDITASYGFKTGGASGDFGFGKDYSSSSTSSNKLTNLQTSIKTIGGSPEYGSFTTATSINNLNIDMSGWMRSLNDKRTHSIIDIADNGLVPITDFIMEENLKRIFATYYAEGVLEIQQLQEPYIELASVGSSDHTLIAYLYTRFGDKVLLCGKNINSQNPDSEQAFQDIKKQEEEFINYYTSIYKLKCILYGWLKSPLPMSVDTEAVSFNGLEERRMQRFTYNNKLYLLYSNGTQKYAYSIHSDYLLDTYAIREFVNTLPTVQILPEKLFDYTIVAL